MHTYIYIYMCVCVWYVCMYRTCQWCNITSTKSRTDNSLFSLTSIPFLSPWPLGVIALSIRILCSSGRRGWTSMGHGNSPYVLRNCSFLRDGRALFKCHSAYNRLYRGHWISYQLSGRCTWDCMVLHWLQDFQREKPCGMPNPWCCPPSGAWRARRCGFMWAPVTHMRRSWWMEEVVAPTWGEIRHSAWILPQHCEVMELMEKWRSTSNAPIPQVWISQLESSSAGQESTRARAISGPFIQTSLAFGKLSGWRPVPSNTWLVCRWWPNWRNWISGIWSCKQKSPPKLGKLWNWWLLSSQIEAVEIRFVKAPHRSMTPRTWPFNSWCPRKKRNSGARKIRICMVSSYICRTKEGKWWTGSPPMLPWEVSPAMETRSAWMEILLSCGWSWIKVTTPMPGFCWVRGQGWFSRKIHRLNGESTESTEIAQESSS